MTRFICGPTPGPGLGGPALPMPDQHGTARAIWQGESVVPVFHPGGRHVADVVRLDSGNAALVRPDGTRLATFGPRPRVAAVRHALSMKGKHNAN